MLQPGSADHLLILAVLEHRAERSIDGRFVELLGVEELDAAAVDRTLGSVLKYSEDQEVVRAAGLEHLVAR